MLDKIKSELSPQTPGIKPLCPTHWTLQAESLRSLLMNYNVIQIIEEYKSNVEASTQAKVL